MADKSVGELIAAQSVTPTDLFVLEQNGTAKKLTGQILENWLVSFADGHGGIQSIEKLSTNVLADTYRITLADTTTFDFVVTNGRGITGISKTGTSGLVDTYTIRYNNGTTSTFTVTNGEKGDKGDNAYIWIKYASQEPTESSHSMGDIPDDWIGIYYGNASTAPTDWKQYKWFKHKGEKGDTGNPATLVTKSVTYQVGDSGTIIPSGSWGSSIPVVSQGKYLWTKTEVRFNTGDPIVSYSVARMGIDGTGSVSSVAGVSPDATGNVTLTAADVGALAVSGGDMEGAINMNGQPISGLNDPTEDTQAARKGYVDAAKAEANAYTNASVRKATPRNLLDNSDFRNPVNQRGQTSYTLNAWGGYCIDRWRAGEQALTLTINGNGCTLRGEIYQTIDPKGNAKNLNGKTVTIAAKVNGSIGCRIGRIELTGAWDQFADFSIPGGRCYIYADSNNDLHVGLTVNDTVTVEWVALYEGEYTAATLPEYQPKGYAVELAECQRYYYTIKSDGLSYAAYATGTMNTASSAYFPILFPIPMRTIPTFFYSGSFRVYVNGAGRPVTSIGINAPSRYTVRMSVGGISSGVSGQACELQSSNDGTAFIAFSADL